MRVSPVFTDEKASLVEKKDRLKTRWVLLSIIGSGVAISLLQTSLNPILNFMLVTLFGSLFVMMTHQSEVLDAGVIENEIPTMDAGPANTKSFYQRAITIKLFLYLLIALPLNAYVAFTEHQLLNSYIVLLQEFLSAFS